MKTDEELKQIAVDLYDGKILCDQQVTDTNALPLIFMPLAFMGTDDAKKMQDDKIALIYEYYDQAGPRGINGYPSFFSMQVLNMEESEKMFNYFNRYKRLKDNFNGDKVDTKKQEKENKGPENQDILPFMKNE